MNGNEVVAERLRGDGFTVHDGIGGTGFTDKQAYLAGEKARTLDDLTASHSPAFLPPLQPTLRTGTEALVAAALAWLAPHRDPH